MLNRWSLAAFGAVLVIGAAGSASAAITVLGGGFAQACSEAAVTGEVDPKFEELCTLALETEALDLLDRAGPLGTRGVSYPRRHHSRAALKAPEAALADITRAIELGVSEPAKAHYNRALAYERLGDLKSAWLDYTRAAELDPEWSAPRTELSRSTVTRK